MYAKANELGIKKRQRSEQPAPKARSAKELDEVIANPKASQKEQYDAVREKYRSKSMVRNDEDQAYMDRMRKESEPDDIDEEE